TMFLFFFQAEDGIRAFHVTGVQTCALPICAAHVKRHLAVDKARRRRARLVYGRDGVADVRREATDGHAALIGDVRVRPGADARRKQVDPVRVILTEMVKALPDGCFHTAAAVSSYGPYLFKV